ncbi:S-(hydroxymethyl)glutathione dehydrogenase/alcohol dehydrogenase/S-(hydroxymethyl)mycothiol dehydrogenase [Albidovulum inexpectatum]|uniref:S-(Hydroxymethyl)glutathione dehydrogenase/alcohol dehydrogenase/S-(Hydroxymethyl)mycothiol dehydrogenase n=1 Tax=Albidovulum inexpectatum TaxID=196587 RepID=A0A2S5JLB2_9RHOB|nr:zinc-binding dehydrogenase [Albidovulum inexpectatum]PPB82296.1 S-(hydroxymethyl)glutathione dehydrogenase/alcohol dehydrogenase/S-(hydroxymethyl)mycothiol dehydrogenase [Albidovulum inexpectatum]
MPRIKAAICPAAGKALEVDTVELRAPLPGEVEVTIEACAICHSDISYIDGAWGGDFPAVFGHEAAGRISAAPAGASLPLGARVLVTLIRSCGRCAQCAAGHPTRCAAPPTVPPVLSRDGQVIGQGMNCAAFAERVVVHESQVVPLPEGIDPASGSLLSCGVITGLGAAINTARVRPGEVVVVIGAGGVGLNAIQGARLAGAARVIAVDLSPEKLEIAREFGATDGVLATAPKPWTALRALVGRGADAVLVAVGAIPAYETAGRYLAPGGRIVAVGMPPSGAHASYEPVIFAATGQGIMGSFMGDVVLARDIPWITDLVRQGRIALDRLISGRWRLDQINEAIADTRSGGARRNVILFEDRN